MKRLLLLAFLMITSLSAQIKDITVSILPQKYFVEKIAKDKINVNVMVRKGFSPATYEPKTSQMRKLAKSEIYFAIDVPFEDVWLEKFKNSNKNMLVVDTDEGIKKLEMKAHVHHEEEKHDEHEGHDHTGLDPHIWLDPVLVKIQAKNIYEALVKIDGANKEFYLSNYKQFVGELEALNKELKNILSVSHDKAFMVFHPSWGYFAKDYNLEQLVIEVEGKEPKPKILQKIIKKAREEKVKAIFTQTEFSDKSARVIADELKIKVIKETPLAANWSQNLIEMAKSIANNN